MSFDAKVEIESNTAKAAKGNGGGFYLYGGELEFKGIAQPLFVGNTATNFGGAIYSVGSSVIFSSSQDNGMQAVFIKNKGKNGGAIYSSSSKIIFYNMETVFEENEITEEESGGAIYANYSTISVESSKIKFNNNKVINSAGTIAAEGGYGLGIYSLSSKWEIKESELIFTSHTSLAKAGGAIYSQKSVIEIMENSKISFIGNRSNQGGAIYVEGGLIKIEGYRLEFTSNTAYAGGAIYAVSGSSVILGAEYMIFEDNESSWWDEKSR
jgi:predicted outer membrane repeat protein